MRGIARKGEVLVELSLVWSFVAIKNFLDENSIIAGSDKHVIKIERELLRLQASVSAKIVQLYFCRLEFR